MSNLMFCRSCFATDQELRDVSDETAAIFIILTGLPSKSEYASMMFCMSCEYLLRKISAFRDRCLRINSLLTELETTEQNNETMKSLVSDNQFKSSLKLSVVTCINYCQLCDTTEIIPSSITKKTELKSTTDSYTNKKDDDLSPIYDDKIDDDFKMECDNDVKIEYNDDDEEDGMPLIYIAKENRKGKKEDVNDKIDYAKLLILSKEEQLNDLNERSKSDNFIHSPYKCDLCFRGFVDETAFDNHLKKHDISSGTLQCDICKLRYTTQTQLKSHKINSHERRYQCIMCSHISLTANQAREHLKWHEGFTYECKLCAKKFKKPTSYFSHMRKLHASQFVCVVCGDNFVSSNGLLMHTSKTHKGNVDTMKSDDERRCEDCQITFLNELAWRKHVLCSLEHIKKSMESKTCEICGEKFTRVIQLQKHLKTHKSKSNENTTTKHDVAVQCSRCTSTFDSRSKLKSHFKRVHLKITYTKTFVCEVCGKHCTSNATLSYHQRTHTGEKPYPCPDCPKHFADHHQLNIHHRIHSDVRPYQCHACDKSFRQKPTLNRHMRVHTGAKPYSCTYCGKSFSQSSSMKKHVNAVHLKIPDNRRLRKTTVPSV